VQLSSVRQLDLLQRKIIVAAMIWWRKWSWFSDSRVASGVQYQIDLGRKVCALLKALKYVVKRAIL